MKHPMARLALVACLGISVLEVPWAGATIAGFDHLKCYKIKDYRAKRTYTMDLFSTPLVSPPLPPVEPGCIVKTPAKMLCLDVLKQNVTPPPFVQPAVREARSYLCYKVKCPSSVVQLPVYDQIGGNGVIQAKRAQILCAPELLLSN